MKNIVGPYSDRYNDLDFKEYISGFEKSDVFKAYKFALNNSKQTILAILEDKNEKEYTIFIAGIAYRISMQMKKEMDDTNYEVQKILENALEVEHNYIKAA